MTPIVQVEHLCKYFKTPRGQLHAVEDLSFAIEGKTTLGVVGESGCGKSTLGRTVMGLHESTAGVLRFAGEDVTHPAKAKKKALRRDVQMIFQDPYSSLDPRMCVSDLIAEPMKALKMYGREERDRRVAELMDTVGLSRRFAFSYPHELDGGRRQRIGIARALSVDPKFIAILVMYLGCEVEMCVSKELFKQPLHPYTKGLLSAIPIPSIHVQREEIIMKGEVTSPINPKPGCRFASRCPYAKEKCHEALPEVEEILPGHLCACHYVKEINGL